MVKAQNIIIFCPFSRLLLENWTFDHFPQAMHWIPYGNFSSWVFLGWFPFDLETGPLVTGGWIFHIFNLESKETWLNFERLFLLSFSAQGMGRSRREECSSMTPPVKIVARLYEWKAVKDWTGRNPCIGFLLDYITDLQFTRVISLFFLHQLSKSSFRDFNVQSTTLNTAETFSSVSKHLKKTLCSWPQIKSNQ